MSEPLEESYFNWLCAKVLPDVRVRIYHDLLLIMHRTEFVWNVLDDKNRAEDGVELRDDFLLETGFEPDEEFINVPCSVLEMLYALAKRAEFQTGDTPRDWFWKFVANLGLDEFRQVDDDGKRYIDDVLYKFIWRLYEPSGHGGLFPMRWPQRDQRGVEIWYQFCEYVDEQGLV